LIKSVAKFVRKVFTRGKNRWEGDNVTYGTIFGGEDQGNKPFGIDELGDIKHFQE